MSVRGGGSGAGRGPHSTIVLLRLSICLRGLLRAATLAAALGLRTLATGPKWTGDSGCAGRTGDSGSAGQEGASGSAGQAGDSGSARQAGDSGSAGQAGDPGSTGQAGAAVGMRRRDSLVRGAATGGQVRGCTG